MLLEPCESHQVQALWRMAQRGRYSLKVQTVK